MGAFWHDWLYVPLLNALIWLYQGPAFGNLGLAIVELTVVLRVALLPFTIIDERSRSSYERLSEKIGELEREFRTDPVRRKEKIRELLKDHRVSYWSKVFVLGVQGLVLVLIYQVFMAGIRFTGADLIYPWISPPAAVNTDFFGFDLAARSWFWATAVAAVLFAQIYAVQKKREHLVTKADVMYMIFFPLFTLAVLMLLPMVKSLFILTSLFFGMVIFWIRRMISGWES
ncbi:YidC/Oxa1 family membrane protein insertase [Candidatus Uhrbacteria bacterium]|nr:YidC/Oxa1 family membrane protein insertase [Candidatus Uhrbacteria bacterium]